jgi:hypothetical protein
VRITIGTPALDRPTWTYLESLLFLDVPGGNWTFRRAGPLAVAHARNELVAGFLASGDDWLLLVDADAVLHRGTLRRLLSWDKPLVSALAFMRYGPCHPAAFRGLAADGQHLTLLAETAAWLDAHPDLLTEGGAALLDPRPDDALVGVDRVGCHCLLVHRDALAAIEPPWFVGDGPKGHGEDFYFCAKAQAAGWPIMLDRSVVAGHLYGERPLGALDFTAWRRAGQGE